jgi:hypothetical protein
MPSVPGNQSTVTRLGAVPHPRRRGHDVLVCISFLHGKLNFADVVLKGLGLLLVRRCPSLSTCGSFSPTGHLLRPTASRHRSWLHSFRNTQHRGPAACSRTKPLLCRCQHPRHRRYGRPAPLRLGLLRQGQGHSRTHRPSASARRIWSLSLYPKSHVQRRSRTHPGRGVALR